MIIQDAVIQNFEIIGEAAKQISEQVFEKVPSVPWCQIAGFRDVPIHGYMGILTLKKCGTSFLGGRNAI